MAIDGFEHPRHRSWIRCVGSGTLCRGPCTRMRTTKPHGYQLKIALRDVRPPVWRRLVVTADLPLPILHVVFQVAMGWTDSHLHLFRVRQDVWAPASEEGDYEPLGLDTEGVPVSELAPRKGSRFVYEYDFGDGWVHDVVVEKVPARGARGIAVPAGQACVSAGGLRRPVGVCAARGARGSHARGAR